MSESTVPTGHAPPSSANDVEYFQLFNARNAKIISCVILAVAIVYHALLRLHYGEDTCIGLLEDGRYQGSHIWQPYGCMLHTYTLRNARMCMKYKRYWGQHNYLLFIGDQRTRQLYFAFLRHITAEEIVESTRSYLPITENEDSGNAAELGYTFVDKELNLTLEFVWDPNLKLFAESDPVRFSRSLRSAWPIIVTGSLAPVFARKGNEDALRNYSSFGKVALSPLVLQNGTQILWMMQGPIDEARMQTTTSKTTEVFSSGTKWNEAIDQYNYEMERILAGSRIKIWRSASLIGSEKSGSQDGVQMGKIAVDYNAQILLNLYCNDYMNFPDGTCCRRGEPRSNMQTCACLVYVVSILLTCALAIMRKPRRLQKQNEGNSPLLFPSSPSEDGNISCSSAPPKDITITLGDDAILAPLFAWSKFCALMLLIYACDRTNYFMNENKWFTLLNFFLPVGYFVVLGLFFTEKTGKTGFMHQDQTNEWKGWMLLIIMVYNMTGASQVIWIYMLYRSLLSGFLFLLGYRHFIYFWTTGDFTLRRFLTVCLRYNLLAFLLCLTMNRPYQFYYYTSLITFWFIIIYITVVTPPRVTASSSEGNSMHYFIMIVKFVVLYSIVSVLYLSEVFFEKIFLLRPWKALFVMPDDSIEEWWQRWWLDRYTVANGMVCAFAVSILRRYLVLTDGQPCNLFSRRLFAFSLLAAVCGLIFYGLIAIRCGNHLNCNEIHGYISFVPVLSYLILRNLFGAVRTRVSTFFAWFGKISLELFTAQPHLWLAADSHGILVLLPRWPVFNVIITSFMFVCFAHEMNLVTKQLIPLIVCHDNKVLLRNLLILLALGTSLTFLFGLA